ncbi:hypothetical protein GCM10017576_25990 [Microbacterium barkeri]|uniref:Uncharacterized protein n=1 Tax=Microbacterium barkeri TaxID=33917 RepID=A0A9W6LX45_9MICO|nr:hypothetical protein [Microbacterium barkeri]MDR6877532.1 hypothetical protein [Microbacterium barkeri]GLJ62469.1 hypothetical protein GCM10017576_25990 [Microbacterium barkeri]
MTNPEEDDEFAAYSTQRTRRIRITAWIAIVALIATGGGSALFALLFP